MIGHRQTSQWDKKGFKFLVRHHSLDIYIYLGPLQEFQNNDSKGMTKYGPEDKKECQKRQHKWEMSIFKKKKNLWVENRS